MSSSSAPKMLLRAVLIGAGVVLAAAPEPAAQQSRDPHAALRNQVLRVGRLDHALILSENPNDPMVEISAGPLDGRGGSSSTTPGVMKKNASGGTIPFGMGDADGDGLTDAEELDGWDIVVDENGFGTAAEGAFLTIRHVTGNINQADGDGDGIGDYEEWLIGSDPGAADTDGDGLDDNAEWNVWFTSTNSVDSDGDARGPNADLPPNAFMFDSIELDPSTPRTSPTLADTDGDGRTDFEEVDHPVFHPLISELPSVAITVEGSMDVRLDVEYAEAVVQEKAYETSLTLSSSTTKGSEKTSSSSESFGWSTDVTIGYSQTVGVETGAPPSASGEVTASQEVSAGINGEVTKEKSFTSSQETSKSTEQTSSQYVSDSQEFTETAATGSITLPIRLQNDSDFAYTVTNLGITLLKYSPNAAGPNPAQGGGTGQFKSMGTIVPDLTSVTLAPGESTPIINLDSGDLNADVVKEFMAHPSTLVLQPAIFDMVNAEGVDFDFISETTFTQTALVEVDDGLDVRTYRVATNVDRDGFEYEGVSMASVMTDILGIPYTVVNRKKDNGNDIIGTNDDGQTQAVMVLTEVDGVAADYDIQGSPNDYVTSFWTVATDADLSKAYVGVNQGVPVTDFESIRLFGGDSIRLIFSEDKDGDGLSAREEAFYGTSDDTPFSDPDGMTDYEEVVEGWESPPGSGHFVYSDPRQLDTDGDGRGDAWERNVGKTDPQNPDSDGDGLSDLDDPAPLDAGAVLRVAPVASGNADGSGWNDAMTLVSAVAAADSANSDGDSSNDVTAIWMLRGAYEIDAPIDLPPGAVTFYGGFSEGDGKVGDRDPNPQTNETTLLPSASHTANNLLRAEGVVGQGEPAGAFDGLTITGGKSTTNRAINVSDGRLVLRNMLFVANHYAQGTVQIFSEGSVEASNCEWLMNTSATSGAAVRDKGLDVSTYTDCVFSLNRSTSKGGAVYRSLPFNPAVPGAVPEEGPEFTRCTFFGNQVYAPEDLGNEGQLRQGGGAVYTEDGGRFVDCDFFGNQTGSAKTGPNFKYELVALPGGALYYDASAAYDCAITLINSRFFENRGGEGGAVFVNDIHSATHTRSLNVVNCTLVRNVCLKLGDIDGGTVEKEDQGAGGLHVNTTNQATGTGQVVIRNSLITENASFGKLFAGGVPDDMKRRANIKIQGLGPLTVDIAFCTIDGIYDDEKGNFAGNANSDDDPMFVQEAAGNLRLQGGSPAIDFGVNTVDIDLVKLGFQPLPLTDLDGNMRIAEGDGIGAATVDRGAYEYQP